MLTNEDFSIVVNVLYMATISGVELFHVCAAVFFFLNGLELL